MARGGFGVPWEIHTYYDVALVAPENNGAAL